MFIVSLLNLVYELISLLSIRLFLVTVRSILAVRSCVKAKFNFLQSMRLIVCRHISSIAYLYAVLLQILSKLIKYSFILNKKRSAEPMPPTSLCLLLSELYYRYPRSPKLLRLVMH